MYLISSPLPPERIEHVARPHFGIEDDKTAFPAFGSLDLLAQALEQLQRILPPIKQYILNSPVSLLNSAEHLLPRTPGVTGDRFDSIRQGEAPLSDWRVADSGTSFQRVPSLPINSFIWVITSVSRPPAVHRIGVTRNSDPQGPTMRGQIRVFRRTTFPGHASSHTTTKQRPSPSRSMPARASHFPFTIPVDPESLPPQRRLLCIPVEMLS
ncbi:hypothetical protein B0H11DRAFT_1911453 [Mycena galericulata]|nr:hypothetical protein B0H11DRAFT_1911453 [Mycena galericulata]